MKEETSPLNKPKLDSASQKELDKAEQKFDNFNREVQQLNLDSMNKAPKMETEQQTKLSQKEIQKTNDVYLKATKSIGPGVCPKTGFKEKFNEKFRKDYELDIEYVRFIAENKEIIGETIEIWTKPYAGMNLEFWQVPTNKPVWGPRHLAEQIKKAAYHRFRTEDKVMAGGDWAGSYTGAMIVDNVIQRLDAHPVSEKKSIFMGASSF